MARSVQVARRSTKKTKSPKEIPAPQKRYMKTARVVEKLPKAKPIKKIAPTPKPAAKQEKKQSRLSAERTNKKQPSIKQERAARSKSTKLNMSGSIKNTTKSRPKAKQSSIKEKRLRIFGKVSLSIQEKKAKAKTARSAKKNVAMEEKKQKNISKSKNKQPKESKTKKQAVLKKATKPRAQKSKAKLQPKPTETIQKKPRQPSKYFLMRAAQLTSEQSEPYIKPEAKPEPENLVTSQDNQQEQEMKKSQVHLKIESQRAEEPFNEQSIDAISQRVVNNIEKSIEQLEKIKKNREKRIFMIMIERTQSQWAFKLMESKGNLYTVTISTKLDCNCVHFRLKKHCKHIGFIVNQVGQTNNFINELQKKIEITEGEYAQLDCNLTQKLRDRMKGEKQVDGDVKRQKLNQDCDICFWELESSIEKMNHCESCYKKYHHQCLSAWRKVNTDCPLCKKEPSKQKLDDSLGL